MPTPTAPAPAFTQALTALCRQHGYDEFVAASFEPATGQILLAASPAPASLTPAMQAMLASCQAVRTAYQDGTRPLPLEPTGFSDQDDEEEDDMPDDGWDFE